MPDENLPDFATLQKTRQHLFKSAPFIAFEDNIRDPENHPFPTPSGKIEIFSKRLYDMQHPEIRRYRTTFPRMKARRMRWRKIFRSS